jgi:NAD(P) transhydrogenase
VVTDKKEEDPVVIDHKAPCVAGAKNAGILTGSVLALGAVAPDAAFSGMLTTFALSDVIGVQVVLGVAHALHSPLMAVTNAISGATALGGMHLFAHSTGLKVFSLGAAATTLSAVNVVGEFSSCQTKNIVIVWGLTTSQSLMMHCGK